MVSVLIPDFNPTTPLRLYIITILYLIIVKQVLDPHKPGGGKRIGLDRVYARDAKRDETLD